jgi:coproporphyrinogen III oxidase-like Fe-S oxidoreductase
MKALRSWLAYRLFASRIRGSFSSAFGGLTESSRESSGVTGLPSALYLHIPFCRRRCSFCSFFSVEADPADSGETGRYMEGLERELDLFIARGKRVDEIFIGGGTPALAGERLLSLICRLRKQWPEAPVSVELAPEDLLPQTTALPGGKASLLDVGCSRVSIGVQSFQPALAEASGRCGSLSAGLPELLPPWIDAFPDLNLDLMYALPGQSLKDIEADARLIKQLAPPLVTWYPLITTGALGWKGFRRYRLFHDAVSDALKDRYERVSPWSFTVSNAVAQKRIPIHGEYLSRNGSIYALGAGTFSMTGCSFSSKPFSVEEYLVMLEKNPNHEPVSFSRRVPPFLFNRFRYLMTLFSMEEDGRAPERVDRFISSFAGLSLPEEDTLFFLSLLMRDFLGGVDCLRTNMMK